MPANPKEDSNNGSKYINKCSSIGLICPDNHRIFIFTCN